MILSQWATMKWMQQYVSFTIIYRITGMGRTASKPYLQEFLQDPEKNMHVQASPSLFSYTWI